MLQFWWLYEEYEDMNYGGFVSNKKFQKKRQWREDNENNKYIKNCVRPKYGRCSCEWCSCARKMGYKTQTEAVQAAIDINYFRPITYTEVYPYKCRYCSNWHIGHSNRGLGIVA